jgi:tetratricopeptide (TPR) repeat protein
VAPVESKEAKAQNMDALKWNEEGNACFSRGAYEDAINAYNKAVQLDPLLGIPYSNLALTYLAQGDFAESVLLFQKSIGLLHSDTDKAVSWNGLGNAYRCMNDYANARAAYQKAAELDPTTAGIRDRADDFHVTERPRDAQGWNDLGELLARSGSVNEAIHAFQRAIEMDPQAVNAYGNLARALASQNKYQETIPLYQKSIDLLEDNKDKAAAWNRLGNVYRKLNDYDNAIKAYQKAVVLADEGVDLLTRTRFSLLSNCYVNP